MTIIYHTEEDCLHANAVPDYKDRQGLADWIDRYVTAEKPYPISDSDDPVQINRHNIYVQHISTSMTHKCYSAKEGGCILQNGKCKRCLLYTSPSPRDS